MNTNTIQQTDIENQVVVYKPDEKTQIETRFDGETVWLTQHDIAKMFGRSVKTISHHIKNAMEEELAGVSTFSNFEIVAADGKMRTVKCYNLDAVLSVGYRVKSPRGTQFRRWANNVLKERITHQNALQSRVEALERRVARLTGGSESCVNLASRAASMPSTKECVALKDAALVSLVVRDMIRHKLCRTMEQSAIFIRAATLDGWLQPFGISTNDVVNMIESYEIDDFMPNYYTFPSNEQNENGEHGVMFVGRDANPQICTEVPVIGGTGAGCIVSRFRGRQIYGVICRLAMAKM